MEKRKNSFIIPSIVIVIAIIVVFTFNQHKQSVKTVQKEEPAKTEESSKTGYLSIIYIKNDSSLASGSMMEFYTYDLDSGQLDMKADIPSQSQYSMGAVSLHDNKIYYTYREEARMGN